MDSSRDKLSDNVSLLIEAISNLVLCTITGDRSDIQKHCASLAEYTQKVVFQAKDIAIEARNKETTKEITKCTNDIADSIEKLIGSFITLISNFSDTNAKKQFAETSKNVGLAINSLIIAADTAASRKVIELCNNSKELQANILRKIPTTEYELLEASREFGENTMMTISQGKSAAGHSADPSKSSLLLHSINKLNDSLKEFLKTANTVQLDSSNIDNKNELAAQYKGLSRIYNDIIDAASIIPDFSSNINDAFDRFNKMLDLANAVRQVTSDLYNGVLNGISLDEFNNMAKKALQTTMDLIQQALKVLESETDPIRREQIQKSINDTKKSIKDFIQAAKLSQMNPNNLELRKEMTKTKEKNDEEVSKLLALTSKDMDEEKLYYTCLWLEDESNTMMNNAPNLSSNDLQYYANRIAAITERVAKDARAVAMKTNDPSKRERILNSIDNLQKAGDRYIGDIKNLSRNPGDSKLLQRLGITHKMFGKQIHKVLIAAGLEEEKNDNSLLYNDSDSDIIRAAKEQARLALQIIKDALIMAEQIKDPILKQQLLDAIGRLKQYASDVIHFAQIAAEDPDNLDKQIQLDEAQRLLADGIRNVITLTSSVANDLKNLMDSMANEDDINVSDIFKLAEQLVNEITSFVDNINTIDPKQVVIKAKELANLTNQLSIMIRKIADKTSDPRYKEQLTGLSRFMRDRATQVKMIAAVKVACGGDAGQVSSASNGLKTTVNESISVLKASELKRRKKRTANRAAEIRKVIEMWKNCKSY